MLSHSISFGGEWTQCPNVSLVGPFGTMLIITAHFFSDYRAIKVPSFKRSYRPAVKVDLSQANEVAKRATRLLAPYGIS
jgi:hypothetical protein